MTKQELRTSIKNKLKNSSSFFSHYSSCICNTILNSQHYLQADTILAYMALQDEVDLTSVIKTALSQKKRIALPRIIPDTQIIEFFYISDENLNCLEAGSYNIKEPEPDSKNRFSFADNYSQLLILTPGRAFTTDGKRLGRGKGFYDIFFSKIPEDKKNRVCTAGVCFPEQIVSELPADKHDYILDKIFTL